MTCQIVCYPCFFVCCSFWHFSIHHCSTTWWNGIECEYWCRHSIAASHPSTNLAFVSCFQLHWYCSSNPDSWELLWYCSVGWLRMKLDQLNCADSRFFTRVPPNLGAYQTHGPHQTQGGPPENNVLGNLTSQRSTWPAAKFGCHISNLWFPDSRHSPTPKTILGNFHDTPWLFTKTPFLCMNTLLDQHPPPKTQIPQHHFYSYQKYLHQQSGWNWPKNKILLVWSLTLIDRNSRNKGLVCLLAPAFTGHNYHRLQLVKEKRLLIG